MDYDLRLWAKLYKKAIFIRKRLSIQFIQFCNAVILNDWLWVGGGSYGVESVSQPKNKLNFRKHTFRDETHRRRNTRFLRKQTLIFR